MTKRLAIVFEENGVTRGNDVGFNVYVEGLAPERSDEIKAMNPKDATAKLSAVEFWTLKCFAFVVQLIQQAGAVEGVQRRPVR
jgi:hypothetical protein